MCRHNRRTSGPQRPIDPIHELAPPRTHSYLESRPADISRGRALRLPHLETTRHDNDLPNPVARPFQTSCPIPPDRDDIRQALGADGFIESERSVAIPEAVLASLARCANLLRSIADGGERAFEYVDAAAHQAAEVLKDVGRTSLLEAWKLEDNENPDNEEV
jgi:hypothetical protein